MISPRLARSFRFFGTQGSSDRKDFPTEGPPQQPPRQTLCRRAVIPPVLDDLRPQNSLWGYRFQFDEPRPLTAVNYFPFPFSPWYVLFLPFSLKCIYHQEIKTMGFPPPFLRFCLSFCTWGSSFGPSRIMTGNISKSPPPAPLLVDFRGFIELFCLPLSSRSPLLLGPPPPLEFRFRRPPFPLLLNALPRSANRD